MPKTEITVTLYGPDAHTQAEAVEVFQEHLRKALRRPELNLERGFMDYTISDRIGGGRSDEPERLKFRTDK